MILDQLCRDSGFHRKHAIRILNETPIIKTKRERVGPSSKLFHSEVKLIEKIRVGEKYKSKHSKPMTPYHRLMECCQITEETKKKFTAI